MNEWQNNNPQQEEREIDILRLLQIVWSRAWLIVLVAMIFGVMTYVYSACFITPTYRSSFTAYVNNRTENFEGNGSTTTSDLNASLALTYLYQDIIVSRSVLLDASELCGLDYGYAHLKKLVSTSVDTNSALISVSVVDTDPVRAVQLATAIAEVAPGHVERVRDGSSMRILDAPVQPTKKSAPSNTKNAIMGATVGGLLSVALLILFELINDKVRNAEELEYRYKIIAIGVIPDLSASETGNAYGYQKTTGSERK